ncbi:MAG: hypothetical protein QOH47_2579 [Sphingomonadales bacterium]|nr:hypothetical protein [Sphingomonadales bacterium]
MPSIAAMFAPLIAIAAAAAAAAPAELPGIWQGTVGNLPVRACFARPEEWGSFGAYFYLSRGQLIALEAAEGANGTFREGVGADPNRPRWRIERADAARLTAQWTGGGRTLPVRLNRVAGAGGESPCSSLIFHRPRLTGVRTVTARASRDGVAYARIALDHGGRFDASVETFALAGASAAVRRINAILGRALTGDPPEWFDCIRAPLEQGPNEGSFNHSLEPTLISSRWMSVIHQYDDFCGGAYPNAGRTYRTFDLASGREIDLHDWLNGTAVEREGPAGSEAEIKTLRPALRDLVLTGWNAEDAECVEGVRSHEFWEIGLTREALVFSPHLPHVAQACGAEFTISFARLRPFLTEEGAENLRRLQAEGNGDSH